MYFGIIALLLYLYNNILDVTGVAVFPYQSFRWAIMKCRAFKTIAFQFELIKVTNLHKEFFILSRVNAGLFVLEKVVSFTYSSLFGFIKSNTFRLKIWLMYEISVYHNFLGVPFKSLCSREVQASQTWLCIQITRELWPPRIHVWSTLWRAWCYRSDVAWKWHF